MTIKNDVFKFQDDLVRAYIEEYHLNEDQAEAIKRVGSMFSLEKSDAVDSVLLIHGKIRTVKG